MREPIPRREQLHVQGLCLGRFESFLDTFSRRVFSRHRRDEQSCYLTLRRSTRASRLPCSQCCDTKKMRSLGFPSIEPPLIGRGQLLLTRDSMHPRAIPRKVLFQAACRFFKIERFSSNSVELCATTIVFASSRTSGSLRTRWRTVDACLHIKASTVQSQFVCALRGNLNCSRASSSRVYVSGWSHLSTRQPVPPSSRIPQTRHTLNPWT